MEHTAFAIFLIAAAAAFALLEIQIEGAHGWAKTLPTWRIENRWTRLLWKKPLTGYHLYAQVFLFVCAHAPFGLGLAGWGVAAEMRVLAFVALFWVLEDFLWFVCNPAYGLRRFNPQSIPWHRDAWWWIAPRDYWIGIPCGMLLYGLSA